MRILITGAGGTLGQALAPLLASSGHAPVLADIEPITSSYEFVQADVRNRVDMERAMRGISVVVHAAAIHGIHLGDHSPDDFYELNLTGTLRVWEAAVQAGVQGVVFSSTMGVYGASRQPESEESIVAAHEDLPLRPTDIYGYTKLAGEEMCRYYARRHGIRSVGLRFGMFVPEPFFRYGVRLLYGGVDIADVARAVLASVDAILERRLEWEAFNVHSLVPFRVEDGAELRRNPLPALDRYYAGAAALLRDRGVESLHPIDSYFPMERMERRLGFRPERNFEQWLDDLKARRDQRSPSPVPWP